MSELIPGINFILWSQLNDWTDKPFGRLVNMMSDLSEEYICAGWLSGCEFHIWKLTNKPGKWGSGLWSVDITEEIASTLLELSKQCGGWPAWNEEKGGVELVPIDNWIQRFEIWKSCIQEKKT